MSHSCWFERFQTSFISCGMMGVEFRWNAVSISRVPRGKRGSKAKLVGTSNLTKSWQCWSHSSQLNDSEMNSPINSHFVPT